MPGIFVRPDPSWQMVRVIGSFDVDADMPNAYVRNTIFPERRARWIRQMAALGYVHQGGVYLFPNRYAVTETGDNDAPKTGAYEHEDSRRERVNRKMMAYFWRRVPIFDAESVEGP